MKEKRIKTRKREPMVDKELIGIWKKTLKPSISSWLLKTNYEGLGEQDKEEFERDFGEILDLALIGLNASGESKPKSDLIERQVAIDALADWEAIYTWDDWCNDHKNEAGKYHITAPSAVVKDLPPAKPEHDAEFWRRRAEEYSDVCFAITAEMAKGIKFDSIRIDENGITFGKERPERKVGEWVQVPRFEGDTQPDLECPFCKHKVGWWDMTKYCAECGADMRGKS